jgi:hypothetical protein
MRNGCEREVSCRHSAVHDGRALATEQFSASAPCERCERAAYLRNEAASLTRLRFAVLLGLVSKTEAICPRVVEQLMSLAVRIGSSE